jgi:D-alanyl-D-alanine carboxypeptidase
MLVNKYYKLSEDYNPEVEAISSQYSYAGKYASKMIIESIQNLIDSAKDSNLKLIVSAGYRSYKDQEKIYNDYKVSNGIREADNTVSRPGHSDYQTGLAVDIEPYAKRIENVSESEEYQWLLNNMHRFGFIQRFPEGKESITGFKYSAWHLRYVGVEAATYIHDNNITFEEYYGYKF